MANKADTPKFFDLDAERAVLGSIMISQGDVFEGENVKHLGPADFYQTQHQVAFLCMLKLYKDVKPIDPVTIIGQAGNADLGVGDKPALAYLTSLLNATPSSMHAEQYATIVKRYYEARRLYTSLHNSIVYLNDHAANLNSDQIWQHIWADLEPCKPEQQNDMPKARSWTVDDLLAAEFPEPTWCVPDLIPTGLVVLAGRPKVGKSWLALQIAGAVGSGGIALGQRVKRGNVLYLALEDSPRRLRDRLTKQRTGDGAAVTFFNTWPTLGGDGGLVVLQETITENKYNLVIIDTLSRIIGKADQLDLAQMTDLAGNLQRLAQLAGITILLIDHHRKKNGFEADPIDDLMGSTGKAAVCDAAMGLYKERGKQEASLRITGRDIEEQELALKWDGLTCCWQALGAAGDVRQNNVEQSILNAIRELEQLGTLTTGTRIAQHIGKDRGFVQHTIANMLNEGKISKGSKAGREQPYTLTHT